MLATYSPPDLQTPSRRTGRACIEQVLTSYEQAIKRQATRKHTTQAYTASRCCCGTVSPGLLQTLCELGSCPASCRASSSLVSSALVSCFVFCALCVVLCPSITLVVFSASSAAVLSCPCCFECFVFSYFACPPPLSSSLLSIVCTSLVCRQLRTLHLHAFACTPLGSLFGILFDLI